MSGDLFDELADQECREEALAPGAVILRAHALAEAPALLAAVEAVTAAAPFRTMSTPGGYRMSVTTTSCGPLGWVSDEHGYRYAAADPHSGRPWPPFPAIFIELAQRAAALAGYPGFRPDACLLNRYAPGARLSLHQDRDERELSAPIVSVSLGLPAIFQFGGLHRSERPRRYRLAHGDVVVWGGPSRLAYHGVLPVEEGNHPLLGRQRINLTFRKVR